MGAKAKRQSTVDAQLREILERDFQVDADNITSNAVLDEDFAMDSLDRAELQLRCETEFSIPVPEDGDEQMTDEFDNVVSYQQLVAWVDKFVPKQ